MTPRLASAKTHARTAIAAFLVTAVLVWTPWAPWSLLTTLVSIGNVVVAFRKEPITFCRRCGADYDGTPRRSP